jgi:predicted nucleic acid-binding Zn ribbon protein
VLLMTPATRAMLRTRPRRRKLRQQRREGIISAIVAIIREDKAEGVTPTLFTHEATILASLRAGLCLEGWGWKDAHHEAKEILDVAFNRANAVRPRWLEGQPEWTAGHSIYTERTRCAQCQKPLPEDARIFCTARCYDSFHTLRRYHDDIEASRLAQRLKWKAWREKQDPKDCEWCGTSYRPTTPGQRFCGNDCSIKYATTFRKVRP